MGLECIETDEELNQTPWTDETEQGNADGGTSKDSVSVFLILFSFISTKMNFNPFFFVSTKDLALLDYSGSAGDYYPEYGYLPYRFRKWHLGLFCFNQGFGPFGL